MSAVNYIETTHFNHTWGRAIISGEQKAFFLISGVYLTVECECMPYLSADTETLGRCLSFLWWGINERGVKRQSLLRYPFLPSFFFHIVRGYSSYDPLELHPGGQIQGAGWRDLLILAMQAPITQRGRERAIFKPRRHKGGDQLADFGFIIPLQAVKQKFHSVMPASGRDLQVRVNSFMCYSLFYCWITICDKIALICLWSQETPNEHR